jgi:hypothetical protein
MIRVYITMLALAVMFTSGCKQSSSSESASQDDTFKPTGGPSDLVYNPMRTDGTLDSSYLPIITWKEEVYDFGTVFEGDIVTKDFYFTNTGTAPIVILKASSTCGCTVPEWPSTPIQPDSTASIKVKFNTLDKPGDQSKEVTIFANTFPNQSKITIKGKVDKKN